MTIDELLVLQRKTKDLVLIKEGKYLSAYNESCYILTQLLGFELDIEAIRLKRVGSAIGHNSRSGYQSGKKQGELDSWAMVCKLTLETLQSYLPDIKQTDFGARLSKRFDLLGYMDWYKDNCRRAISQRLAEVFARDASSRKKPSQQPKEAIHLPDLKVKLNQHQWDYLTQWQKNKYPIEIDNWFIESLKANLKQD